jgi:hypothetical protein
MIHQFCSLQLDYVMGVRCVLSDWLAKLLSNRLCMLRSLGVHLAGLPVCYVGHRNYCNTQIHPNLEIQCYAKTLRPRRRLC